MSNFTIDVIKYFLNTSGVIGISYKGKLKRTTSKVYGKKNTRTFNTFYRINLNHISFISVRYKVNEIRILSVNSTVTINFVMNSAFSRRKANLTGKINVSCIKESLINIGIQSSWGNIKDIRIISNSSVYRLVFVFNKIINY